MKMRLFFILIPAVYGLLIMQSCQTQGQKTEKRPAKDFPFHEVSIVELQEGYATGKFSVREVVQAYLSRIEAVDKNGPALNSVIQINPDALEIAEELDKELQEGNKRGPLHGIPVLLKDNIDTHDKMMTTAGSKALAGSKPLQDSYVARKLRESGAVILGKANLSEWANFRGQLSTSGWSGLGGQTKNPYDTTRNPCGSSSGSGVAVSANLTVLAIGTETNGSVVCPSHANGIVGIKPTVGLISRSGIIPISFTQDTPGPMARTLEDAVICLGVLTGIDSSDTKTLMSVGRYQADYTSFLDPEGLEGKRIGIVTSRLGMHDRVDSLFRAAVEYMKTQGAEIIEVEEILGQGAYNASLELMLYEYKDGLNRYFASLGSTAKINSLEELIEFNRKDDIELRYFNQYYLEQAKQKEDLTSDEYLEALETARKGSQDEGIDKVMDEHRLDALIAPTGSPAWKTDLVNGDHFILGSSSPAAIAGYPNITVPMGFIDGLPVGISFFGRAWSEPVLIAIAFAYEQGTGHRRAPVFDK